MAGAGEVSGSTSAKQMPSVTGAYAFFRAPNSNAGDVYLGFSGVTKPDGTTDTTTGIEIAPSDYFGPVYMPGGNLNTLYIICDNAGDDILYMVMD